MDESLNSWFAREVLAHEAALVRYLARTWPIRDEVADLRQETYIRVYEAAKRIRPTYPKSFLYPQQTGALRRQRASQAGQDRIGSVVSRDL